MRLMLLILSLTSCVFAQTGQMTGQIMDPAGTSVPGARVVVKKIDTSILTEASTNEQGYYTFPLLSPGTYELNVQKVRQGPYRRTRSSGALARRVSWRSTI